MTARLWIKTTWHQNIRGRWQNRTARSRSEIPWFSLTNKWCFCGLCTVAFHKQVQEGCQGKSPKSSSVGVNSPESSAGTRHALHNTWDLSEKPGAHARAPSRAGIAGLREGMQGRRSSWAFRATCWMAVPFRSLAQYRCWMPRKEWVCVRARVCANMRGPCTDKIAFIDKTV